MAKKQVSSGFKPLTLEGMRAGNIFNTNNCTLNDFLKTLAPTDRKVVLQALKDSSIQIPAIHRELKARGYEYSHQVLARHRRQGCTRCFDAR